MKFFILLVSLLMQVYLPVPFKNKHQFLDRYVEGIKPLLSKLGMNEGYRALLAIMAPILIIIGILSMTLAKTPVLYFLFGLVILSFCLNIVDMKKPLGDYFLAFANENIIQAQIEAEQFSQQSLSPDKNGICRAVTEAIFTRSLTHIFSMIFWFMLIGPLGAVLYFLTTLIEEHVTHTEFAFPEVHFVAHQFKQLLDWLPVRLVTLTYALIGHFSPVIGIWMHRLAANLTDNSQLLIDAGLIAIHADASEPSVVENHHALSLITRTLWTWMITIGLFTVAAWL